MGGDLNCSGAQLNNPKAVALKADRAQIAGSVFMEAPFSVNGEVNLVSATVGGSIECEGGKFNNANRMAIDASAIDVGVNAFFRYDFSADGEINLILGKIGKELDCTRGSFDTLQFRGLSANTFVWQQVVRARDLDLEDVTVETLMDDVKNQHDLGSWDEKITTNYHLTGLTYKDIKGGSVSAKPRIAWLARQIPWGLTAGQNPEFVPQPYAQLETFLRGRGDDVGADEVLFVIADQTRAQKRRNIPVQSKRLLYAGWHEAEKLTIGYGLYSQDAIVPMLGMTLLGWIIYRRAHLAGAMAPTDKDACQALQDTGRIPEWYPPFNPLVYSIENCLPLVRLGLDDRWQPNPHPSAQAHAPGWRAWLERQTTSPGLLRCIRWLLILLGWVFATFFVAGLTGIIHAS